MPLCGEFTGDRWIPPQMASYAENVSIWWRHHGFCWVLCFSDVYIYIYDYICHICLCTNGLAQECNNSIAKALELLQSCDTCKPLTYHQFLWTYMIHSPIFVRVALYDLVKIDRWQTTAKLEPRVYYLEWNVYDNAFLKLNAVSKIGKNIWSPTVISNVYMSFIPNEATFT